MSAELVVVVKGFCLKVLTGTSSFTNVTVPAVPFLNAAILKLNLISSICSGVQVYAF